MSGERDRILTFLVSGSLIKLTVDTIGSCLIVMKKVDNLEDFIRLEVIHLFERLDVLRDIGQPADGHRDPLRLATVNSLGQV